MSNTYIKNTVSYTHLDVYKRQVKNSVALFNNTLGTVVEEQLTD